MAHYAKYIALVAVGIFFLTGGCQHDTFTNYGYEDAYQELAWGKVHSTLSGSDHRTSQHSIERSSNYEMFLSTAFVVEKDVRPRCSVEVVDAHLVGKLDRTSITLKPVDKVIPASKRYDGAYEAIFEFANLALPYQDYQLDYKFGFTGCSSDTVISGSLMLIRKTEIEKSTFWDKLLGI